MNGHVLHCYCLRHKLSFELPHKRDLPLLRMSPNPCLQKEIDVTRTAVVCSVAEVCYLYLLLRECLSQATTSFSRILVGKSLFLQLYLNIRFCSFLFHSVLYCRLPVYDIVEIGSWEPTFPVEGRSRTWD